MANNRFSQHGEELIILDFFKGKTDGRFLDIGANDSMTGSNTRALAELGWGGLLIEASPRVFQQLIHNCRGNEKLVCINAPVMGHCGMVKFHEVSDQCGTCTLLHQPANAIKDSFWMNATCPEMIAAEFGGVYDFVSLDIEGSDLEVLQRMAPVLCGTQLLCIEDAVPFHDFVPEYYDQMITTAAMLGLSWVVARTNDGRGNTLLARP